MRETADDPGESLGRAFGPLEGLGALATVGGLAALTKQFASTGAEIARTSASLGLNTTDLQKWRAPPTSPASAPTRWFPRSPASRTAST
jgi:hypothetical protein